MGGGKGQFMADNDKDQEKTEQATPKRREEARKKGSGRKKPGNSLGRYIVSLFDVFLF